MNDHELLRPAGNVSGFLLDAASATESLLGFGWCPQAEAPDTYPDLQRAVRTSLTTGLALPVSNQNTDSVIYSSPDVNIAYRFVHDVTHVLRGLDFTAPHELRLAQIHLGALHRAGYGPGSPEYRLFEADAIGQVRLNAIGKRFPVDQRRFTVHAMRYGIDQAVAMELQDDVAVRRPHMLPPTPAPLPVTVG